jgi:dolichol-phosphate mannosyltransferase
VSYGGRQKSVNISIIIPCYNEEKNIKSLRKQLLDGIQPLFIGRQIEFVFVDDGSTDKTWYRLQTELGDIAAENLSVKFIRHEENRGLGAAIRTGFDASDGEILVTVDSDGTYAFSEIPALLDQMGPDVSVVTASPYHPDGNVEGVPTYRLILSRGSSFVYRLLVAWNIHTYTSLFRAYRREIVEDIEFTSNDYLAGTEILVKAILSGKQVIEYPTTLRVRKFGTSKARIIATIRSHLIFQLKILAHMLKIISITKPTTENQTT